MQDNMTEFSVLVDRSVGGSSIVDGQIELMLHRYAFNPIIHIKRVRFQWCGHLFCMCLVLFFAWNMFYFGREFCI
jgi:hypothetical protein